MASLAWPAARAAASAWLLHPLLKPLLFALSLLPLAWMVVGAVTDQLGANPAETLIRDTGDWALRFLCVTLAITPVRVTLGLPPLLRLRRMAGLFVYFYAALHLLSYAWFDMGFEAADIARDIAKRPFILVGFLSFLLLSPLAATSFNRALKALGARRWQALHKLVYLISLLGLLHFFWMRAAKNNLVEVAWYAAVLVLLLGWRVGRWLKERRIRRTPISAGFSR